MSSATKAIDRFNSLYRDRIRDAVWNTIIEASRDQTTGVVLLPNYEIYDALLQLQAMIFASSKQAVSPAKIRDISNDFARRFRRHVAGFKKSYDHDGMPFGVIHTDEIQ